MTLPVHLTARFAVLAIGLASLLDLAQAQTETLTPSPESTSSAIVDVDTTIVTVSVTEPAPAPVYVLSSLIYERRPDCRNSYAHYIGFAWLCSTEPTFPPTFTSCFLVSTVSVPEVQQTTEAFE